MGKVSAKRSTIHILLNIRHLRTFCDKDVIQDVSVTNNDIFYLFLSVWDFAQLVGRKLVKWLQVKVLST